MPSVGDEDRTSLVPSDGTHRGFATRVGKALHAKIE